jgi:hypothetical protein
MGLVVPINRVVELIEGNESLKKLRDQDIEKNIAPRVAKMDSAFSVASPSNGENPTHREDFSGLLRKAADPKNTD